MNKHKANIVDRLNHNLRKLQMFSFIFHVYDNDKVTFFMPMFFLSAPLQLFCQGLDLTSGDNFSSGDSKGIVPFPAAFLHEIHVKSYCWNW